MIIPGNVTVYMNGRAYYAHVCGFYQNNERLSLTIDTSCLKRGGDEVNRADPPRREISVTANASGKSVVITYDPHDPEAAKAAETWRGALFSVKSEDGAKSGEQSCRDYLSGAVERYLQSKQKHIDQAVAAMKPWTPDNRKTELEKAAKPLRDYLKAHGDPHTSVIVTQCGVTETQDERRVTFDGQQCRDYQPKPDASDFQELDDVIRRLAVVNEPTPFGYFKDFRSVDLSKVLEWLKRFRATLDSEGAAETVKRGRWEKSDIPCEKYVCSECGGACWYYDVGGNVAMSRYCPNCGAHMENAPVFAIKPGTNPKLDRNAT